MTDRGPIAWMARNRVTPNLVMMVLIVGGLFATTQIQKEVFPAFDRDEIRISMGYRGASPEEIEQGILLPIEEALQGIDGIEVVRATASEGSGPVRRIPITRLSSLSPPTCPLSDSSGSGSNTHLRPPARGP